LPENEKRKEALRKAAKAVIRDPTLSFTEKVNTAKEVLDAEQDTK